MQVRHNTALLEQAVELVVRQAAIPSLEAEARAKEMAARSSGFRRLATGGAIAVAAIGVGLGVFLGFWQPEPQQLAKDPQPKDQERVVQAPIHLPPEGPRPTAKVNPQPPAPMPPDTASPGKPDVVTVDFTKFSKKSVAVDGREWALSAGHYFADENDATWQSAWCYSNIEVGGVDLQLNFARRESPGSVPIAPISSSATFAQVGLTDEQARRIAAECPWLDERKFVAQQFDSLPGRSTDVPAAAVAPPVADPAPVQPEFAIKDGWDAMGHDLPNMPILNVTFEWCQMSCESDVTCLAVTYNKSARACFHKGDATIAVVNQQSTMAVRHVVEQDLIYSDLVFAASKRLIGAGYARQSQIVYPECVNACASTNICKGFNYDRKAQVCELLSTVSHSADARDLF